MNLKRTLIFIIVALYLFYSNVFADIDIKTKIDTNNILIGEPITITTVITLDKLYNITWAELVDTTNKIEILYEGLPDTNKMGNTYILTKLVKITSFDSGTVNLNPLLYIIEKNKQNDIIPISSNIPAMKFNYMKLDSTAQFVDIKAPIEEPVTFEEVTNYVLVAISILLIGFLIFSFIKNYKPKEKVVEKYDPKIPAHILAIKQLQELDNSKLWQKDEHKKFYIILSEIIRLYLARRYSINALEMTTNEIKNEFNTINIENDLKNKFLLMLDNADLTKFAKYKPLPDENFASLKVCFDFVDMTKKNENETITEASDPEASV